MQMRACLKSQFWRTRVDSAPGEGERKKKPASHYVISVYGIFYVDFLSLSLFSSSDPRDEPSRKVNPQSRRGAVASRSTIHIYIEARYAATIGLSRTMKYKAVNATLERVTARAGYKPRGPRGG